jgi:hypothetical protein
MKCHPPMLSCRDQAAKRQQAVGTTASTTTTQQSLEQLRVWQKDGRLQLWFAEEWGWRAICIRGGAGYLGAADQKGPYLGDHIRANAIGRRLQPPEKVFIPRWCELSL